MKEIVLIFAVTAIVVFGYFIMKKLDAYVSSNRLSLDKKGSATGLRLALDNPMIFESLSPLLDEFSKTNPGCPITLFFATEKEISDRVALQELDFGFVTADDFPDIGESVSVCLSCCQGELRSPFSDLSIKPLHPGQIEVSAVWRNSEQSGFRKAFADLLVLYSHKNRSRIS